MPWSLPSARPAYSGERRAGAVVLGPDAPRGQARLAAGERLIAAPATQPGERLIDAVAMMDKLRTAGPWESEQTHDSLRRYLLEETYELFDAVRSGDADELRDELGDVLLQVLFHARIAEDAPLHPFTIDDVADALIRKLGNRAAGRACRRDDFAGRAARPVGGAQSSGEAADLGDGRRADRSAGFGIGAKVIQRVPGGLPLRPDSRRDHIGRGDGRRRRRKCFAHGRTGVYGYRAGRRKSGRCRPSRADVPAELDVAPLGAITEDEWRACWPAADEAEPEPEPVTDQSAIDDAEASSDDPKKPERRIDARESKRWRGDVRHARRGDPRTVTSSWGAHHRGWTTGVVRTPGVHGGVTY